MKLNNYRMMGYAQIAIGFINLVYQNDKAGILGKNIFAVFMGSLLIALTFILKADKYFSNKTSAVFWSAISTIVVGVSLI
jgi:hypothetical protein